MDEMEKGQVRDVEDADRPTDSEDRNDAARAGLRLDPSGLPLSPQPSSDPMDPLNWKLSVKLVVLAEVSILSFLALLSASLITPAFVPLSEFVHRGLVPTAYVTSLFILCAGLSTIFWNPVSNVYGRRPVYILTVAVGAAMSAASGAARSYGQLLAFRCLNGFFGGVPLGLGSATVCDMFFAHERGLYMGVYTVTLITGGHVAPIIGGYIERDLTWHWCFYVPAILTGALWLLFVLTVPETLYSRVPEALARPPKTWTQNMLMVGGRAHPTRRLHLRDFARPFEMLRYPSVLLPTAYYSVSFAYGSILFIITSANLFREVYHYKPQQTGLLLGIPITVGSLLGEMVAGWLSDRLSERRALARGGRRSPEDRLLTMIPATILLPLGTIVEGVCLERETHWIGVAMGIAIASTGLQIATTGVYTYTAECYKPQSPELGSILNFGRQLFSFSMGFYAIPFAERIGVQDAWIAMAMVNFAFSLPLVVLFFKGAAWRQWLGDPKFHWDL